MPRFDLTPGNWTVLSEDFLVMLWLLDEEVLMKKSRFSGQQIAFTLKQADDGISVKEVCRKAGI